MNVTRRIIPFFKANLKKTIAYCSFAFCSLVIVVSLLAWALKPEKAAVIISTELFYTNAMRREFIVGETYEADGIGLVADGEIIPAESCKIEYDFTSAGIKPVTYTYETESKIYKATRLVDVFAVSHIDIHAENVKTIDLAGLEVWADLDRPSTEFTKPAAWNSNTQTAVILRPDQFSVEIIKQNELYGVSFDGVHTAMVYTGNKSKSFTVVTNPDIVDINRIMPFSNDSGGSERLELYVTDSSNGFVHPESGTVHITGTYRYYDKHGNMTEYNFKYDLVAWNSIFDSSSVNDGKLTDKIEGEAIKVDVNGVSFTSSASANWRRILMNMNWW